ncbi:MAG: hypothetical protein RSD10_04865 [Anaerovoracaceae bacterium]
MKRKKLLLKVATNLSDLAESVKALAEIENDIKPKAEPVKKLEYEEVRAILAEKSKDGFTKEVKELLKQFGANKLGEIDSSKYEELVEKAGGLGNE